MRQLHWVLTLPLSISVTAGPRVVTVTDSVTMTRIVNPDVTFKSYDRVPIFYFSPDGSHFAFVTRKGDMVTQANEYSLVLFAVANVRAFLAAEGAKQLPPNEIIAQFSISPSHDASDRDAISNVKWMSDNRTIAFIGRQGDQPGQVFVVDVVTRKLRKLTESPDDIVAFDLALTSQRLVYAVHAAPDWRLRNMQGYVVSPKDQGYLLGKRDPRDAADLNMTYMQVDLASDKVTQLAVEPSYDLLGFSRKDIAVSPSGQWSVVTTTLHKIPAHWVGYEFIRDDPTRVTVNQDQTTPVGRVEFKDAFAAPNIQWAQYQLVNLRTGSARPLLDAPTVSETIPTNLNIRAQWSTDGTRVLLPPTFLPLEGTEPERRRRARMPAIADVEIATGIITHVFDVEGHRAADGSALRLTDVAWHSNTEVTARFLRENDKSVGVFERYARKLGRWGRTRVWEQRHPAPGGASNGEVMLRVAQDLNVPPEVAAIDLRSGIERVITDLNPDLRRVALGAVRLFSWTDRFGRRFDGGLVLPPNYDASIRYPVVIQANTFDPHRFLLDSSMDLSGPDAAQALASRGMLVLQMNVEIRPVSGKAEDSRDNAETELFVAELEGAIEAMDSKGLIDPTRVGLIGFSRYGMYVQYALAFSRYAIAAATVADSLSLTPYCYSALYGSPYPGMSEFELASLAPSDVPLSLGAEFWGEGVRKWFERSYIYHLDRIRTPIRFEAYGTSQVPCNWEPFAILKRYERPVEMIHIPLASHILRAPNAVLTSKRGNVDWFAFWLKDNEDVAAAKTHQYAAWRKLRVQQQKNMAELHASRNSTRRRTCTCEATLNFTQPPSAAQMSSFATKAP